MIDHHEDSEHTAMRKFGLSTKNDDQPDARGTVTGTRSDALAAAREMDRRTGVHHLVEPDGAYVVPAPGTASR